MATAVKTRSSLLPIFLIVLVDIFGFTLVFPLLAIYAEHFHASPVEATLLVSVYALCQLFAGPFLGRVSDRIGRKPMLLVSQAGTLVGFVLMARAQSLWVLYVARIIDGLTAGNLSLAQAVIADNTDPKDRAKSFAVIGIAFGLGFFIGPFVTGQLVTFGLTAPIWLAAAMSATSILFTAVLLPGGRPPHQAAAPAEGPAGKRLSVLEFGLYRKYFRQPVLAGLLLQFFLFCLCFATFTSGFALFAERRFTFHGRPFGPREVGWVFAYAGFLGIVLQGGLIGRLVKRFGEPALVASGFLSLTVGYGLLAGVRDLAPLVAVATVSSFGNGILRPTLTSLITQSTDRADTGVVLGLTQSLNSAAAILAPALGGLLITRGWLASWAGSAALAGLAGLFAVRFGSARFAPRAAEIRAA